MSYDYVMNYILVGDTAVGKSCLLLNFLDKTFKEEHMVTVGVDFGSKIVDHCGTRYKLLMWDTAGQETFNSVARSYYKNAVGVLLVYDVSNKKSYENIEKWLQEIEEFSNGQVSVIVVGNKTDLEEKRKISYETAEKMAKGRGMEYIETSAKQSKNIDEAFLKLTSFVHEKISKGAIEVKRSPHMKINTGPLVQVNSDSKNVPASNCAC